MRRSGVRSRIAALGGRSRPRLGATAARAPGTQDLQPMAATPLRKGLGALAEAAGGFEVGVVPGWSRVLFHVGSSLRGGRG
jgi:hypothetical protein